MFYRFMVCVLLVCAIAAGWAEDRKAAASSKNSPYLFLWAGDATHKSNDLLIVVDADPKSSSYGRIVNTIGVGISGSQPHHTEYEFPPDNRLFANGWVAGRTFVFDLNHPRSPQIAKRFDSRAGYSFPHSFVRLPNGNVLATFQSYGTGYAPGGGLVELNTDGDVVRSGSAVDPAFSKDVIWPYSLAVVPGRDLVVSSSTPMGRADWAPEVPGSWSSKKADEQITSHVQLWRLSTLHLQKTITLPADGKKHDEYPAEPRLLPDGTVYVNTFKCGLFRLKGLDTDSPAAEQVFAFPGGDSMHTMCSVPVVMGHYWIQTVGALPGLVVLDISNPAKPVEVSSLKLDPQFPMPHWLAADRKGERLILTGDDQDWALIINFDMSNGTLHIDEHFREAGAKSPGIKFDRQKFDERHTGVAAVHGAVFGPAQ